MATAKRKQRWVRLYTDVGRNRFVRVKFSDAKKAVDVGLLMHDALIEEAKRGVPWECVVAKGTLAAAQSNPSLFPHPVLHCYVTRRTIYIVDKVNGQPIHAVRYQHEFSDLTQSFDRITKREFQKQFGATGLHVHMRPVVKRGGDEPAGARETRAREHSVKAGPYPSRGALRRAIDAGFELPDVAQPRIKPGRAIMASETASCDWVGPAA